MNPEFAKMYRHPQWQKRKAEILKLHNHTCQECGAKDKTLHAHHCYYVGDTKIWDYPDSAFHCLCEDCHLSRKNEEQELKINISSMSITDIIMLNSIIHSCVPGGFSRLLEHILGLSDCFKENKI